MTFLLPIIASLAIQSFSGMSFSSLAESSFVSVSGNLSHENLLWLESIGEVKLVPDRQRLQEEIEDPSTQMIGVLEEKDGIKTLLSGDELEIFRVIGHSLPLLHAKEKDLEIVQTKEFVKDETEADDLKTLLLAITLVTAMFMGCTFNAMSIIGEKEDGVEYINQVLPMSRTEYTLQKISLGLLGGIISTLLTTLISVRISLAEFGLVVVLIVLSSFAASLLGLFIGKVSSGMMVGITYLKVVLILFLAPPILFYLALDHQSLGFYLSYLLPSSATFYALMELLSGTWHKIPLHLFVLGLHCILWLLLYLRLLGKGARCRSI